MLSRYTESSGTQDREAEEYKANTRLCLGTRMGSVSTQMPSLLHMIGPSVQRQQRRNRRTALLIRACVYNYVYRILQTIYIPTNPRD